MLLPIGRSLGATMTTSPAGITAAMHAPEEHD
jgi:hypothetical protein